MSANSDNTTNVAENNENPISQMIEQQKSSMSTMMLGTGIMAPGFVFLLNFICPSIMKRVGEFTTNNEWFVETMLKIWDLILYPFVWCNIPEVYAMDAQYYYMSIAHSVSEWGNTPIDTFHASAICFSILAVMTVVYIMMKTMKMIILLVLKPCRSYRQIQYPKNKPVVLNMVLTSRVDNVDFTTIDVHSLKKQFDVDVVSRKPTTLDNGIPPSRSLVQTAKKKHVRFEEDEVNSIVTVSIAAEVSDSIQRTNNSSSSESKHKHPQPEIFVCDDKHKVCHFEKVNAVWDEAHCDSEGVCPIPKIGDLVNPNRMHLKPQNDISKLTANHKESLANKSSSSSSLGAGGIMSFVSSLLSGKVDCVPATIDFTKESQMLKIPFKSTVSFETFQQESGPMDLIGLRGHATLSNLIHTIQNASRNCSLFSHVGVVIDHDIIWPSRLGDESSSSVTSKKRKNEKYILESVVGGDLIPGFDTTSDVHGAQINGVQLRDIEDQMVAAENAASIFFWIKLKPQYRSLVDGLLKRGTTTHSTILKSDKTTICSCKENLSFIGTDGSGLIVQNSIAGVNQSSSSSSLSFENETIVKICEVCRGFYYSSSGDDGDEHELKRKMKKVPDVRIEIARVLGKPYPKNICNFIYGLFDNINEATTSSLSNSNSSSSSNKSASSLPSIPSKSAPNSSARNEELTLGESLYKSVVLEKMSPIGENYYCSELVATLYSRLGLIDPVYEKHARQIYPVDLVTIENLSQIFESIQIIRHPQLK